MSVMKVTASFFAIVIFTLFTARLFPEVLREFGELAPENTGFIVPLILLMIMFITAGLAITRRLI